MADSTIAERHIRRNTAMILADYVSYTVGAALMGFTTILPSIVHQLGGTPLAVGSLGAIAAGLPLLPQLFAGRLTANRPYVRRHLLIPCTLSRTFLATIPLFLLLFARRAPGIALAGMLAAFAVFCTLDGIGTVPYLDLMAKVLPADRRGRVFGVGQSLASLAAVGAGLVVERILARPAPFPDAYILLTALGAAVIFTCLPELAYMVEPAGMAGGGQPGWREFLPQLGRILRRDARFVWLAVVRGFAGVADMANAFYVLYATDRLHLPAGILGLFISANMIGGLLGGLLLGPLADRRGPRAVIVVNMVAKLLCPALTLAAPFTLRLHPWLAPALLIAVFALQGVSNAAFTTGFTTYLLEIAPAEQRSAYIGLGNTLGGLMALAPLFAGALLQATSYELLFLATLALAVAGLLYALRVLVRDHDPLSAPIA